MLSADQCMGRKRPIGLKGRKCEKLLVPKGIRRSCLWKKSDPKIGWLTEAILKECLATRGPNDSGTVRDPKHSMEEPLAARRGGLLVEKPRWRCVAGKTDTSAPLSMRKERLLTSSTMEREPETELIESPGPTGARPWRFPEPVLTQRPGPNCSGPGKDICVLPDHI